MKNTDNEKQMKCTAIMSLKEVGDRIGRKDKECIMNWLDSTKITIHRLAKLNFIYKVDFESVLILPQVKDYKKRYPLQWEAYYQKTIKDEELFNLVMLKLDVEISFKPATKVKMSKKDEELYKKLLS